MAYQRVVAKFGTGLLTAGTDHLDLSVMADLVGQVAKLQRQGQAVIIVSSGAVAAGRHKLHIEGERKDIPFKQVLAAVGQSHLMQCYEQLFAWYHITVAQALLTRADLSQRSGYLNARNTLLALLELRVVPIINENDVVAVEELAGATFGDNDNLSAMVANLVDADLLVLLGETAGLYTADPHQHPEARLVPLVEKVDESIEKLAQDTTSPQGIGGMATKIEAAQLATASGVAVVIADGREPDVLVRLAAGDKMGTFFPPATEKLESRRRWLLGAPVKGQLVVDGGVQKALRERNHSLLPIGVKSVEGQFQRGDIVAIVDGTGKRIACGVANYSSQDLTRLVGQHSNKIAQILGYEYGEEIVHRDNLVKW
ncbi:MAG: glutamate 5-kinase [Chloroflexota bacterium]